MKIVKKQAHEIKPSKYNPRADLQPGDPEFEKIRKSIKTFGYVDPIIYNKQSGHIVGGHQRYKVLLDEGITEFDVVEVDLNDTDEKALNIALNKISGDWDMPLLKDLMQDLDLEDYDLAITGFDADEIEELMNEFTEDAEEPEEEEHATLSDRFGVPPFSVLDTRQGYWQKRKKEWLGIGLVSHIGRGDGLLFESVEVVDRDFYKLKKEKEKELGKELTNSEFIENHYEASDQVLSGTSIFDPVLCELLLQWFTPKGEAVVLDPFAGGSVRGIIAGVLGKQYHGIDIRAEQVEANYEQREKIGEIVVMPEWHTGDSLDVLDELPEDLQADFVFSCPPYADLEVYSDNPKDVSNMEYQDFKQAYTEIIHKSLKRLKPNRFACFVVGDMRDKKGYYRNFVSDTANAFITGGAALYNEAILINAVGSLAMRVGRYFTNNRKLGKSHQNILVFYNGDPETIRDDFPEVNFSFDDLELELSMQEE